MSLQISWKSRGVMERIPKRFKLKRGRTVDSTQQEPPDFIVDSYFGFSGVEVLEVFASGLMKS
jgi:hypothetical protein